MKIGTLVQDKDGRFLGELIGVTAAVRFTSTEFNIRTITTYPLDALFEADPEDPKVVAYLAEKESKA